VPKRFEKIKIYEARPCIIPPSLFGTFATKCSWDHLCIFDGDVVGVLSGMLLFFTNIFGMTHLVNFNLFNASKAGHLWGTIFSPRRV
jgi:hypothetical protein